MTTSINIKVNGPDLNAPLQEFAKKILSLNTIDTILAPLTQPDCAVVMPSLVSEPQELLRMDLLGPCFALNTAKMVSKLTRKSSGHTMAVFLRPCEIRAFVELCKLNQADRKEITIIGCDCLGAMDNQTYLNYAGEDPLKAVTAFYQKRLESPGQFASQDAFLSTACRACEQPFAVGADAAVLLYGINTKKELVVTAQSAKGADLLAELDYPNGDIPGDRSNVVQKIIQTRTAFRDQMFAQTAAAVGSLPKLSNYLSACVNCYNCRVACPVCYCRECVFVTDVFDHDPFQYINWARRKGAVKLPTDTVLYHLTRLTHMSTACVGCGQCSNACPNGIGVMELFRLVSHHTQSVFGYIAGADYDQLPPLTEFKEDEFSEVVGL